MWRLYMSHERWNTESAKIGNSTLKKLNRQPTLYQWRHLKSNTQNSSWQRAKTCLSRKSFVYKFVCIDWRYFVLYFVNFFRFLLVILIVAAFRLHAFFVGQFAAQFAVHCIYLEYFGRSIVSVVFNLASLAYSLI